VISSRPRKNFWISKWRACETSQDRSLLQARHYKKRSVKTGFGKNISLLSIKKQLSQKNIIRLKILVYDYINE